jgi:FMN phosphatase YigB (HAD superfamily)
MNDITAVLFDLDGTLLPLDFDEFFPRYLGRSRTWYLARIGRDITQLALACAARMIENDGTRSNADAFWNTLAAELGCDRALLEQLYEEFVAAEGAVLANALVPDPDAAAAIRTCRQLGMTVVLATNPVFPRSMIDERVRWAGLDPDDFDLVTCSDRMRFCKPKSAYYRQIAHELAVTPAACLMIGNDVDMDLVPAAGAGMRTCLLQSRFAVPGADAFRPDHVCTLADVPLLLTAHRILPVDHARRTTGLDEASR